MTTEIAITQQSQLARLIDREQRSLVEAERMLTIADRARTATWTWQAQIRGIKARIKALEAGLLPVRITGPAHALTTLLGETQNIPTPIVDKALEAEERFKGSKAVVYGWDRDALPAERRRRDPVLVLQYAQRQYFLGFWLELATGDTEIPEFMGVIAPWSETRRPGRPRKGESGPRHALLGGGE